MNRKRKNTLKWQGIFVGLGFLLAISWYGAKAVLHSSLFNISQIDVEGELIHVTPEEIRLLSGVTLQDNLPFLAIKDVSKALLKHPWIKEVVIRKQLPNTLIITVWEHHPLALLEDEKLYLVDTEGIIFKQVEDEDCANLPLIKGFKVKKKRKEEGGEFVLEKDEKYLKMAVYLLKKSGVGYRILGRYGVNKIYLTEHQELALYLGGYNLTLYFNPGKEPEKKTKNTYSHLKKQFARAEKMLNQIYYSAQNFEAEYIILDYGPNRALVKFR